MLKGLIILLVLIPALSMGQVKKIGTPFIQNFSKATYKAGTQNWGIAQDKNGFMYFANNDGLLRYDGVNWDLTKVSDSSPLRSVLVDSQDNIYVGMINDFGVISQQDSKQPEYKSLKLLLPEGVGEFDDIWRIYELKEGILFQCFKYLFLLRDEKIEVYYPQNNFHFSFQIDDRLFLQEPGIGFFEFVNGQLNQLSVADQLVDENIMAVIRTGQRLLLGTESNGIYVFENETIKPWDVPANEFVIKNRLYCATELPGGYFAFGTILNGMVLTDNNGNIVKSLNAEKGIQNNTVLSAFVDRSGDLWVGLDNGIDYIEINSPLSFFQSTRLGSGYACKVHENQLYMGTNQGLFVMDLDHGANNNFVLVQGTEGQVWSIEEFEGELICCHHRGIFRIQGERAYKIGPIGGAWKFIPLKNRPDLLIGGHYQGLTLLNKNGTQWQFLKNVKGFNESSRYIVQGADESIWIGHGGKGIFRLQLTASFDSVTNVTHFNAENGLPSNTGNVLFDYGSGIYVATNEGILEYEAKSGSFIFSDEMNRIFDSGRIKTVATDPSGDIWFISDTESGVIRRNEDMTSTKITMPLKKLDNKYVNEFEFIYPQDDENVYVGLEDGFAHYSTVIPKFYDRSFESFITKVELPYLDSVVHWNSGAENTEYLFPFRKNTFRFHFASPFFENENPLVFSYYLEGFSEEWSEWLTDTYKDFTTLHEGAYNFMIKAKNIYGKESEPAVFSFVIAPPWHRSGTAYFVYALLFILMNIGLGRYILYRMRQSKLKEQLKHEQEIKRQEEQHQREALLAEKQIIKLRNDKLRSEMVHRDKELANQTMGIIHKNKFLIRVNEDLNSIEDFIVNETAKGKVYSLKKRIKKEIDIKQQSKIFETYFDEVHEDFFKRLKEKHPVLTSNDLRICAFIRMNLTTQEIAAILNISYRGAEISRYRLRKKLELDRSTNLSTYLSGI